MSTDSRAQKSVQSTVAVPANIIDECVLPRATRTDGLSKDLQMEENLTHLQEPRPLVTVHHLPDIALLEIFWFYSNNDSHVDEWHTLVHVCQRWRSLVFASPRYLNLRLLCTTHRPVRAMLDIWPALPIVIEDTVFLWEGWLDNIIAALEHPDRVCSITIDISEFSSSSLEKLAEAMVVPFPELTHLVLTNSENSLEYTPVLPHSFLAGSAPRLQTLTLRDIDVLFPALPKLLLSSSDLVRLSLTCIPHSEFISPDLMATCLSSSNRLQSLDLEFQAVWYGSQSPRSHSSSQSRVVLPALTDFTFEGMHEYSEDLLARVDAPMLNTFSMSFFLDFFLDVFDVPHFKQFIGRANGLKPPKVARVCIDPWSTSLELSQRHGILDTSFPRIDWQLDSFALVCDYPPHFHSSIERFDLIASCSPSGTGEDDIASARLLGLLRRFTAIRTLHVSKSIVPLIATALQEFIGERTTEVLPNLRDLFLGGSAIPEAVQEAMQQFVTARQLSGQAVAVHHWGSEASE